MKNSKLYFTLVTNLLIVFLVAITGLSLFISTVDQLLFILMIATFLLSVQVTILNRLLFLASFMLFSTSLLLNLLNLETGNLTFFMVKVASWSFSFFVAGCLALILRKIKFKK